jgi:hypothetical protein
VIAGGLGEGLAYEGDGEEEPAAVDGLAQIQGGWERLQGETSPFVGVFPRECERVIDCADVDVG